jgi:peptidoglycan/LPS O-acetylase OafA/YrhL
MEKQFYVEPGKRLANLDILRGIAIIGVLTTHVSLSSKSFLIGANLPQSNEFSSIFIFGRYGVELFFFISGWLLQNIYGTKYEESKSVYWISRAARIYPLWIIFSVLGLARLSEESFQDPTVTILGRSIFEDETMKILIALTLALFFLLFLSAPLWNDLIAGGWSIQSEVFHYILYPIFQKRKLAKSANIISAIGVFSIALWILSFKLDSGLSKEIVNAWLRLNIFATIWFFLLGIGVSKFIQSQKIGLSILDFLREEGLKSYLVFFWVSAFVCSPLNFGSNLEALSFILICLTITPILAKLSKVSSILTSLGKYSYFIYFFHFEVINFTFDFLASKDLGGLGLLGHPVIFLCAEVITLTLSWIAGFFSFKLFESPIMKFAKRLGQKKITKLH